MLRNCEQEEKTSWRRPYLVTPGAWRIIFFLIKNIADFFCFSEKKKSREDSNIKSSYEIKKKCFQLHSIEE